MLHSAIVASNKGAIHGSCLVATRLICAGEVVWELDEPMFTWKEIETWPAERQRDFDWYGFQHSLPRLRMRLTGPTQNQCRM